MKFWVVFLQITLTLATFNSKAENIQLEVCKRYCMMSSNVCELINGCQRMHTIPACRPCFDETDSCLQKCEDKHLTIML